MSRTIALVFLAAFAAAARLAPAVTIDTVLVGNAGNVGEFQQIGTYGAVTYEYRIATTEVTNAQYAEFLNAKAASDPYGLYNDSLLVVARGGIARSGSNGSYLYDQTEYGQ